jgi:hypothetical protein
MKTYIPIRNYLAISALTVGAFFAPFIYAQEGYPIFYENENPNYGNVAVPQIPFPEEPPICAADDKECQDAYLKTLGGYLEGNIQSQMVPSPVYSFDSECVLKEPSLCTAEDTQWKMWQERASSAELDFMQNPPQGTPQGALICDSEYFWWGQKYTYKCKK